MDTNFALKVTKVSKQFRLPHEKVSSIKSIFTRGFKTNRSFETQKALDDINLQIIKGEFFGIVGRNGRGKSTLLKILAGIYQPTSGALESSGKLVPFIELGVGFNPELTGRENVYLNGALFGFSRKEIDKMYDGIVEFAELEQFMDQKLKNYSSGMQVRLAFSVATRAEADILLVDEVLAVGDADFQRKCFNYFKLLKKTGTTVIFVTHDMSSVREYCDRAVMIEKSKIVCQGSPDTVATEYTKLFQVEKNEQGKDSKSISSRWGDGGAKVLKATVTPKSLKDSDGSLQLNIETQANAELDAIVVGFVLKDASAKIICGTNTLLKKKKITNLHAGDIVSTVWDIPNIFKEGDYLIDVAVNHDNGIDVHDWWQEAVKFKNYTDEYSQYIVNPPITVVINR